MSSLRTDPYVTKGTRVRARWLDAEMVCLAGMQPKMGAQEVSVVGVVRHVRSDRPDAPVNVTFFIDPESGSYDGHVIHCQKCGRDHVEVDAKYVTEVL